MKKVGVCGLFGKGEQLLNGQTVKTKMLTDELKQAFGSKSVKTVDTYNWKGNYIKLIKKCFQLIRSCENIIILPAQNGVKVFPALFLILNMFFKKNLHYVVVGGWLPELLEKNQTLKNILSKFDGIYVETHSMVNSLKKMGLNNAIYFPNFKRLNIIEKNSLIYSTEGPYKLCTFSRVMKEKGIEDAIEAVESVNNEYGRVIYTLDIYGQVEGNYKEEFDVLQKTFPEFISYKGVVDANESVNVLKDYFVLLFPTYYEGEGFAGTILDAYASGVPVVASNWRYNSEVVQDQLDGLIFENKSVEKLKEVLIKIEENPNIVNEMKGNCLKRAKDYTPEVIMNDFCKYL
ncbi:glycosyltransferase [Peribacillus frigoritolerans]|uniref:glycosyltransferase family 4 protein n=1 Tax=Peribacillus frigoritolerans TaxID=450367 RepID=UPI002E1D6317|nr:glycosyltransferase [Peribacillus frigoritolerans]